MASKTWGLANEKLCKSFEDDDVEEDLTNVLVQELHDYGEECEHVQQGGS